MNQSIQINAFDDENNFLGIFTISNKNSNDYLLENYNLKNKYLDNFILENIPVVEELDNKTPILYSKVTVNGINIFLLESTQYEVSFQPKIGGLEVFLV